MKSNVPVLFALTLLAATHVMGTAISPACESANRQALTLLEENRAVEAQTELSQFTAQLEASDAKDRKVCLGITLHNLTSALERLGQLDVADQVAARSVSLLEETLGSNAVAIRRPLQLQASIAIQKRQWDRADILLTRAESLPALHHADIAMAMVLRGNLLTQAGKLRDAETAYRQALSERELGGQGMSRYVEPVLSNLASLYLKQGRTAEALRLLERQLQISALFPLDVKDHIAALFNLALAYSAAHDEKPADSYFRQAIDSLAGLPVASRSDLGRSVYSEYASFLQRSGRKRESKTIAEAAQTLFGPDPSTFTVGVETLRAERR